MLNQPFAIKKWMSFFECQSCAKCIVKEFLKPFSKGAQVREKSTEW